MRVSFKITNSGFTLVELLVAIAIIGVVSAIVVSAASAALRQTRNNQRKSDLRKVQNGLAQYYVDQGFYPCSDGYRMRGDCNSSRANFVGFNNFPGLPGSTLTNCTGNPDPLCKVTRTYLVWSFEDPSYPDNNISSHHYCYTSFDNSINKGICDNVGVKCQYYELGAAIETNPQTFSYVINNPACNGGNHAESYAISPLGPVDLPATRF